MPFGIYYDGKPIGFVMIGYGTEDEEKLKIVKGNYSIWRFMIDRKYQNQGFGKEAMKKVLEYIHTFP